MNQNEFEAFCSNTGEEETITFEEAQLAFADPKYVFGNKEKNLDAEDMRTTLCVISHKEWHQLNPTSYTEWRGVFRSRHERLMRHRRDKMPGEFKQKSNQTTRHVFVQPENVEKLLEIGFQLSQNCSGGAERAYMQHYVITAIHPFVDGNGRSARLVMNAELERNALHRAVFTLKHRRQYSDAAMGLFLWQKAEPVVRALAECQNWSASMDWADRERTYQTLVNHEHILATDT